MRKVKELVTNQVKILMYPLSLSISSSRVLSLIFCLHRKGERRLVVRDVVDNYLLTTRKW